MIDLYAEVIINSDAIEIDSSNYNINEVTEIICNFIENALQ